MSMQTFVLKLLVKMEYFHIRFESQLAFLWVVLMLSTEFMLKCEVQVVLTLQEK